MKKIMIVDFHCDLTKMDKKSWKKALGALEVICYTDKENSKMTVIDILPEIKRTFENKKHVHIDVKLDIEYENDLPDFLHEMNWEILSPYAGISGEGISDWRELKDNTIADPDSISIVVSSPIADPSPDPLLDKATKHTGYPL